MRELRVPRCPAKADVAAAYVKGDARSEEHEIDEVAAVVGRFSMATSFTAELT